MSDTFDPFYKWLAIPPAEQPPNHYRLYGIPLFTSDPDVIENAANRQEAHLRRFQDGEHGDMATALLGVIDSARLCLLDPKLRASYDAQLKSTLPADDPVVTTARAAPASARPATPAAAASSDVQPSVSVNAPRTSTAAHRHKKKPSALPVMISVIIGIVVAVTVAIYMVWSSGDPEPPLDRDGKRSTARAPKDNDRQRTDKQPAKKITPPDPAPPDKPIDPPDPPKPPDPAPPVPPQPMQPTTITDETDLLLLVDPGRDAVTGNWGFGNGALLSPLGYSTRLQILVRPPEEYDLAMTAKRTEGRDALVIGLVCGGRQASVVLDGWGGAKCGLGMIDNFRPPNNETLREGQLLPNQIPTNLVCRVRKNGVVLLVNDETVFDWQGDPQRLSLFKAWAVPDPDCLFLGSFQARFEITNLKLTPVTGSADVISGDWRSRIPDGRQILAELNQTAPFVSQFKRPSYAPRTFEAEDDFKHHIGRAEADGWGVAVGDTARRNTLLYGPYISDLAVGGPHELNFRIMSSEARNNAVAAIDVYDINSQDILASREIHWNEFNNRPMQYIDAPLYFFSRPNQKLEFRMFWKGKSDVRVDRVTVAPAELLDIGSWDVKFFAIPEIYRQGSSLVVDDTWQEIVRADPIAETKLEHLTMYMHNRSRANSWFATVATTTVDLPAGRYELGTVSDDGVRVFIDGQRMINNWSFHSPRRNAVEINLTDGTHDMHVEFFQGTSYAQLRCWLRRLEK